MGRRISGWTDTITPNIESLQKLRTSILKSRKQPIRISGKREPIGELSSYRVLPQDKHPAFASVPAFGFLP